MKIARVFLRRRRLWIALAIFFVLLVGVPAGFVIVMRYLGERDLALALAETDQLDPYWRLEDLEAHRPPIPPRDKNGFEQFMAAFHALPIEATPQWWFPELDGDPKYKKGVTYDMQTSLRKLELNRMSPVLLNKDQARVLRTDIERSKEAVGLLRKMVEFPSGRGSSLLADGGFHYQSPALNKLMDTAKLLSPDTQVRIFDGDMAGALQNVHALLHVSRALANEPDVMTQLVSRVIDLVALDNLERTLAGGICSEDQLALMQKELERAAEDSSMEAAFRGNRAYVNRLLEAAESGALSKDEFRAAVSAPSTRAAPSASARLIETIRFALFYGNLPGERARMLRRENDRIRISRLPVRERFLVCKELNARNQQPYGMWSSLTESYFASSAFYKYVEDELTVEAVLACAIGAVAAERFRLAKQRWPTSMDELTPSYLKTASMDLYSGQPLRLVHKGTALIVYSVGANQVDDGGDLRPMMPLTGPDLGFVLHDPDQRRRPGPPFVYPKR
jgi:hypothetical protein